MRSILSLSVLLVVIALIGCEKETQRQVRDRKRIEIETLQGQLSDLQQTLDGSGRYTVHVYDGDGWSATKRDTEPRCSCRFGKRFDRRLYHRESYMIHVSVTAAGQQYTFDKEVTLDWNTDFDISKMEKKVYKTEYKGQVFVWHEPPKKQDAGAWEIREGVLIVDDGFVTTTLEATPVDDELLQQAQRDHEHNQEVWVVDRYQCEEHCPPATGEWASDGYRARHGQENVETKEQKAKADAEYKSGSCE